MFTMELLVFGMTTCLPSLSSESDEFFDRLSPTQEDQKDWLLLAGGLLLLLKVLLAVFGAGGEDGLLLLLLFPSEALLLRTRLRPLIVVRLLLYTIMPPTALSLWSMLMLGFLGNGGRV